MEKLNKDNEKDYVDVLNELVDKINEIIDWINNQ
jgi:hypothetical protein